MNNLKRYAGILWILLGPFTMWYLITTAISEINKKPVLDTKIQWSIFVIIFIPIAIGIMLFGYYSLKGEYDNRNSKDQ